MNYDKALYPWAEYLKPDDFVSEKVNYEKGAWLDLFEEKLYVTGDGKTGDLKYYVYDPTKHGMPADGKYPLLFGLHGAGHSLAGKLGVNWSGMERYASPEYQEKMGGAYIVVPFANEYRDENGVQMTWMTPVEGTECPGYTEEETELVRIWSAGNEWQTRLCGHNSIYTEALFGLLRTVRAAFSNVGDTLLFGTSAGGYSAWRMLISSPESFRACMLMSAAYYPSALEVRKVTDTGTPVWLYHGVHDEIVPFDLMVRPNRTLYEACENFSLFLPEIVRHADGGAASNIADGSRQMGQHCTNDIIEEDLMFDDGTPMDPAHPAGVTGWVRTLAGK